MITLSVDTAAHLCAACIYDASRDQVLARCVEDIGRGHAERLFTVIETALNNAAVGYDDVQQLGVCVGPGSFTGVRIAVAAVRGFSLALSVPASGVTVFDGLALEAPRGRPFLVLLDARRGEVYARLYDETGAAVSPPAALSLFDAQKLAQRHDAALIGSGASLMTDAGWTIYSEAATAPVETIARLAADAGSQREKPKPLYLRAADAKPQTGFAVQRLSVES
ncbi:MAG: tRNA (adenosine(37)-N6)-threonylcarbamoyltransferase complex dimerization subunit type 1 TsaB [Pseudomonadota bacterium]